MEGNISLITINADKVGEAAKVFLEKVSDGVGGLALPWQMKRKAKAEVEVEKIRLAGDMELDELQATALARVVKKEVRKQKNIENIAYKSTLHLKRDNETNGLDEDWIAEFFDKCENVSDAKMQEMWSRILAGEANRNGSFSKKTIDLVSKIDTTSAELFSKLCSYIFCLAGREDVLVYFSDMTHLLSEDNIKFVDLEGLASDGLIHFNNLSNYRIDSPFNELPGKISLLYHQKGKLYEVDNPVSIDLGNVYLSKAGKEIASICDVVPKYEAYEIVKKKILSMGFKERMEFTADESIIAEMLRVNLKAKFC